MGLGRSHPVGPHRAARPHAVRRGREDRGAAVVWTLFLVGLLTVAGALALVLGAAALTRQRAATLADLAALAGAQALDDPCAQARSVTERNAASLVACQVDGSDIVVTVSVALPIAAERILGRLGGGPPSAITVSARAGPPAG